MNKDTDTIGRNMNIIGWVLFLALMTYLFDGYLDKQQNPNQEVQSYQSGNSQEVVLQRNRYGHYVATGTINRYPVTFFLDTGATDISIPEKIANRLAIKKGIPHQIMTANGAITAYQTRLNEVSLGDILLRDVEGHINPNDSSDYVLLGMSFLKQVDFSQQGDKLILKQELY